MTDLFVKPSDTNQFLDPSSSHPYHCKKGIPFSQALRLNRICSDNGTFNKSCNDLVQWLLEKGYNENIEDSTRELLEGKKQKLSSSN